MGTTFLKEAVLLAFDGARFDLGDVSPEGIWVSRVFSLPTHRMYRVSVNTRPGDHYDLLLVLRRDVDAASVRQSIRWMIALHSQTLGAPVVPRFACARSALGAFSMAWVSDLSAWERIREFGARREAESRPGPARVAEPLRAGAVRLLHRLAPQRPAHRARDGGAHQRGGARAGLPHRRDRAVPGRLAALRGAAVAGAAHAPQLLPPHRRPLPGGPGDAGRGLDLRGLRRGARGGGGPRLPRALCRSSSTPPGPTGWRPSCVPPSRDGCATLGTEHYVPLAVRCAVERYEAWDAANARRDRRRPDSSRSRTCTASTTSSASASPPATSSIAGPTSPAPQPEVTRGLRPAPAADARAARGAAHADARAVEPAVHPRPPRGPPGPQPTRLPGRRALPAPRRDRGGRARPRPRPGGGHLAPRPTTRARTTGARAHRARRDRPPAAAVPGRRAARSRSPPDSSTTWC